MKQIVKLWQEMLPEESPHPDLSILNELLVGSLPENEKEALLDHLSFCRYCREDLRDLEPGLFHESVNGELDCVLPMAAHTLSLENGFSILAHGGRFRIIYRPILDQESTGVITLKIEPPYMETMVGKRVVVMDAEGRELLRGKLDIDGEISRKVEDAERIDWARILIRPEFSF